MGRAPAPPPGPSPPLLLARLRPSSRPVSAPPSGPSPPLLPARLRPSSLPVSAPPPGPSPPLLPARLNPFLPARLRPSPRPVSVPPPGPFQPHLSARLRLSSRPDFAPGVAACSIVLVILAVSLLDSQPLPPEGQLLSPRMRPFLSLSAHGRHMVPQPRTAPAGNLHALAQGHTSARWIWVCCTWRLRLLVSPWIGWAGLRWLSSHV